MSLWPEVLRTIASWLFIFPAVFSMGHQFRFLINAKDKIFQGVLYCAIGMACLSYAVVVLGSFGLLTPTVIWAFIVCVLLLCIRSVRTWCLWLNAVFLDLTWVNTRQERFMSIVFLVSLLGLLPGVFSPEIGGDALCYQLNIPKMFLENKSTTPIFYDVNSYFPLLMNHLYLVGLATGGVMAAKFFHFFCGALLFLAIKAVVFEHTENRTIAYFSALVIWLTPLVYNMMSTTYIDIGFTLYSFLSLIIFVSALEGADQKAFFLSGLLLGFALSVKYLGVMIVLALLGPWLFEVFKTRRFVVMVRRFLLWIVGAIFGGGYWMVRNWWVSKNPFFPYFGSFFGTDVISFPKFELLGVGNGVFHFFAVFWNLFYHPTAFGGFSDRIGLFYLLFLPFAVLAVIFLPRSRNYFIFAFCFLILWFKVGQASRYLLPVLPVFLVLEATGLQWVLRQARPVFKLLAMGLGSALLVFYLAVGFFHYRYTYLLFTNYWSPNEYLRRMERTVPIADWINRNLPRSVTILLEGEPRQFYIDRSIIRDGYLKYRTRYHKQKLDPVALDRFFKSQKITHILISDPVSANEKEFVKSDLRNLIDSPFSRLIQTVVSENIRETRFRYRLYELQ